MTSFFVPLVAEAFPATYGVRLEVEPNTTLSQTVIERAADDGTGAADLATVEVIARLNTMVRITWTDILQNDQVRRFYRARREQPGYTASDNTGWVDARPAALFGVDDPDTVDLGQEAPNKTADNIDPGGKFSITNLDEKEQVSQDYANLLPTTAGDAVSNSQQFEMKRESFLLADAGLDAGDIISASAQLRITGTFTDDDVHVRIVYEDALGNVIRQDVGNRITTADQWLVSRFDRSSIPDGTTKVRVQAHKKKSAAGEPNSFGHARRLMCNIGPVATKYTEPAYRPSATTISVMETIRITGAAFRPVADTMTWDMPIGSAYLSPATTDTAANTYRAEITLPQGTVVETFRAMLYRNDTSDLADARLYAHVLAASGLAVTSLLTHASTGWVSLSGSANKFRASFGGMYAEVNLTNHLGADPAHARLAWVELDITRSDLISESE